MKKTRISTRLAALLLALLMALSLAPAALASAGVGMGNFKKVRDYPGFSDVSNGQWYSNDVKQAYELGLMDGKGDGKFDPDGNLTLAEAVTMADRVRAIYLGTEFVSGGSPWYQNAVDYALKNRIIRDGEYTDFSARATRSDFANLLFQSIPTDEFPRINRIAWISDIDSTMPNFHNIYMLYGAGVLTGSETGAFQPNEPVKRCEAAAIINRVALPENRVSLSISTNAPGEVITGANGNFKISIPKNQNWSLVMNEILELEGENGSTIRSTTLQCAHANGDDIDILVEVMAYPKRDLPDWNLKWMSENYMPAIIESIDGKISKETGVQGCTFRGLQGYTCLYEAPLYGTDCDCQCFCLENSTNFYLVNYMVVDASSREFGKLLTDVLHSLDIAL